MWLDMEQEYADIIQLSLLLYRWLAGWLAKTELAEVQYIRDGGHVPELQGLWIAYPIRSKFPAPVLILLLFI